MLVLTRRQNQRILIGEDIVIKVMRIDRNKVRIAITAPPEVAVDREEVRHDRDANDGASEMPAA